MNRLIRHLAVVLIGLPLLTGCDHQKQAPAAAPPEVQIAVPDQQDVPIVREWLGTLDGSSNADIRARVSGYIQEQKYSEGAVVKKDDVLFIIDPRPFEAALAQAKAQVTQAEAQQGRSEAEFQKQKELFDKKVTSQRDFDNANQINLANVAAIDVAKAALQQAELSLAFTKVTAPVDGIAGIANIGIGDLVGPSTGALTSVSTVDPIKAKFPISEQAYLNAAKELTTAMAQPFAERKGIAELVLADGRVFPEKGRLFSMDRQVAVKTGTIALEVLFPNPGNILRPGQYAKVRAVVGTETGALLVPQRAVSEMQGSYSLGIVGADGKAEIRPVKVGERIDTRWVITEGLKPGEKVIVEGIQKVRSGAPVNAKPWTPPATPAPAAPAEPKPAETAPSEAK